MKGGVNVQYLIEEIELGCFYDLYIWADEMLTCEKKELDKMG